MRVLRIVFQIVFGLLSALIIFVFLRAPNADYLSNLLMLAFFIFIILLLGPWWPNEESIERWTRGWKLQLPTDNPRVALYLVNFIGSAIGFYKAWETYENPTKALWRFEKTAHSIAGTHGVIAFWLLLAIACPVYGMVAYENRGKAWPAGRAGPNLPPK